MSEFYEGYDGAESGSYAVDPDESYYASDPYDDYSDEAIEGMLAGEGPPGLPSAENLAALAPELVGPDLARALADERAGSEEFWAEYQARQQYEATVEEARQQAESLAVAQAWADEAARYHDVKESNANGALLARAEGLLSQLTSELYYAGQEEGLARLRSPEGVQAAIFEAAKQLRAEATSNRILSGPGWQPRMLPETEQAAEWREAFWAGYDASGGPKFLRKVR